MIEKFQVFCYPKSQTLVGQICILNIPLWSTNFQVASMWRGKCGYCVILPWLPQWVGIYKQTFYNWYSCLCEPSCSRGEGGGESFNCYYTGSSWNYSSIWYSYIRSIQEPFRLDSIWYLTPVNYSFRLRRSEDPLQKIYKLDTGLPTKDAILLTTCNS